MNFFFFSFPAGQNLNSASAHDLTRTLSEGTPPLERRGLSSPRTPQRRHRTRHFSEVSDTVVNFLSFLNSLAK